MARKASINAQRTEETLNAFKERLIQKKKRMHAATPRKKSKVMEGKVGYAFRRTGMLITLAREVAQKCLFAAGFKVDLVPRESRPGTLDAVYVSSQGGRYWSLPRAWNAFKAARSEQGIGGLCKGRQLDTTNQDLLGKALTEAGGVVVKCRQTTFEWASLLLDDFGILKKVQRNVKNCDQSHSGELSKNARQASARKPRKKSRQTFTKELNMKSGQAYLEDLRKSGQALANRTIKKTQQASVKSLNKEITLPKPCVSIVRSSNTIRNGRQYNVNGAFACMLKGRCVIQKSLSANSSNGKMDSGNSHPPRCVEGKRMPFLQSVMNYKKNAPGSSLLVREVKSRRYAMPMKQTIFSWMIDVGTILEEESLYYFDASTNKVLKEGMITRQGIICKCCNKCYTRHMFDIHTGNRASPKKIVFSSGKSLLECQMTAWSVEHKRRNLHNYVGVSDKDPNDDFCALCGNGGDLICCDSCPSTFHIKCLEMQDVPAGSWYCNKCLCAVCGFNSEIDNSKKIASTVMLRCGQCERLFHRSCSAGKHVVVQSHTFCGDHCEKVFLGLSRLVGVVNLFEFGFSWTLLRCKEEDWSVYADLERVVELHSKLAVALLVMEECFLPMKDSRTHIEKLTHMLYNRWCEFDRLNYKGFYTVILEKGDEIISVASIRVHGNVAEMPLIGTRHKYRRQGMCRNLIGIVEKLLRMLEVATLVIPAIPELLRTWTHGFGFTDLTASQWLSYKNLSLVVFPGTQLLQKSLIYL